MCFDKEPSGWKEVPSPEGSWVIYMLILDAGLEMVLLKCLHMGVSLGELTGS